MQEKEQPEIEIDRFRRQEITFLSGPENVFMNQNAKADTEPGIAAPTKRYVK
jgi:hypothetical protein